MKALTLTQPWATLVAIGQKRIETRSWQTSYRGQIAIHAAKGFPREARNLCTWEPAFMDALMDAGYVGPGVSAQGMRQLPLGCVIAIANLVDVKSTNYFHPADHNEQLFGNYDADRYAWIFDSVKALKEPVPATGHLSLWEWNERAV